MEHTNHTFINADIFGWIHAREVEKSLILRKFFRLQNYLMMIIIHAIHSAWKIKCLLRFLPLLCPTSSRKKIVNLHAIYASFFEKRPKISANLDWTFHFISTLLLILFNRIFFSVQRKKDDEWIPVFIAKKLNFVFYFC